jgi:hypothetical protein
MKIVDMFHGSVFIIDLKTKKVIFEKIRTEEDFKFMTSNSKSVGREIRNHKLYHIVANFALNS